MKIAVSATAEGLDAAIDVRFGRCAYFTIVEVEDSSIKGSESIKNPGVAAMRGAGIQAAQIVASKGVKVVITGNIGPNAFAALAQTGIKIVTGVFGVSVKEAVEKYLKGELQETKAPTMPGFGPGRRAGAGRGFEGGGFGQGRGMGRGGGRAL